MSSSNSISPRPSLFTSASRLSHVTSGVDSRTGNFQASVVLGTVVSGIQDPAKFSLTLFLGTSNHITGERISGAATQHAFEFGFNIPKIVINTENTALSKIYLSSGKVEELIVNAAENTVVTRYLKTNMLKINRYQYATNANITQGYRVSYKDGRIEYYNGSGLVTHMYSPSGAGLIFEYGDSLIPLLKVRNEDSSSYIELSSQALSGGGIYDRLITLTELMDGISTVTKYELKCRSEIPPPFDQVFYISRVSLPNDFERWMSFEYLKPSTFNYYVLSGITTPLGFSQYVSHFGTPRPFSGEKNYPVVARLVEEDIVSYKNGRNGFETNYDYSNYSNFTGYFPGKTQASDVDNCIALNIEYSYSSWEYHEDRSIKRTYNKFHLLTEEVVVAKPESLGVKVTITYTYPLTTGNIDNQLANFSFWTQKSTTYARGDALRTVIETREHDIDGNLISETQASGIKRINEYYQTDSTERQGCPPSPLFIRHLKKSTITSDPSAENKPDAKTLEYSYTQVNGRSHVSPLTGVLTSPYMVLLSEEKLNSLVVKQNTYRITIDRPQLLGVLLSSSTASPSVINITNFNWTVNNRRHVIVTTTHVAQTGEERLTASEGSIEYSPSSGRVHQEISPFGAITNFTYDDKGWLTQKTSYAGSAQEEIETYQFSYWTNPFVENPETEINESRIWANIITTRNSAGLVKHDFLSREGLILYEGYVVPGGVAAQVRALDYSRLSRAVTYVRTGSETQIKTDTYFDFVVTTDVSAKTTETTTFDYMLGQLIQTTHPNGDIDYTMYQMAKNPPFILQSTNSGNSMYRTRYDKYGKVKDCYLFRPNLPESYNTLLGRNVHDGLGRLIETGVADEAGATQFELDGFDRITSSRHLLDVITYEYSTHVAVMGMAVRLNGTVDGVPAITASRTFDAFGRIITQESPGGDTRSSTVVERYTYASNEADQPSVITFNTGRVNNHYDPLTRVLLRSSNTEMTDSDSEYSFVFDPVTKKLQSSTSRMMDRTWCMNSYTYNVQGGLTTEQRTYTQPGKVLTISTSNEYSIFSSRLKSKEFRYEPTVVLALLLYKYDRFGRVFRQDYELGTFGMIKVTTQYGLASSDGGGQVSQIALRVERVPSPALEMTLYIEYGASGVERERSYFFKRTPVFRHLQEYRSGDMRLSGTEVRRPGFPVEQTGFVYAHEYSELKTSTAGAQDNNHPTQYSSNGFHRFGAITTPSLITSYQYQSDRVQSITKTSPMGTHLSSQNYNYNANGNVSNINNAEALTYNASNQMVKFTTSSVPTPTTEYKYFYNPDGQLAQVLSEDECITYIYEGSVLSGEISIIGAAVVKTLYLRANGILLGRYTKKADAEELEFFGVDPSGTIRCAYKYSDQGVLLSQERYDYTDYGERTVSS